jgi:glutathione S-transferase
MDVPDPRTEEGRRWLDRHLLGQSFVAGAAPSQADTQVYNRLGGQALAAEDEVENLARWLANMNSFEAGERKAFPASPVALTIAASEDAKEVTPV